MSRPAVSRRSEVEQADPTDAPVISPTPPLLWWAFAIPAFAVVVYGMQVFLGPRMRAAQHPFPEEEP